MENTSACIFISTALSEIKVNIWLTIHLTNIKVFEVDLEIQTMTAL